MPTESLEKRYQALLQRLDEAERYVDHLNKSIWWLGSAFYVGGVLTGVCLKWFLNHG